jgi:hypothetical protein
MKRHRISLAVLALVLGTSPARAVKPPAWIDGRDPSYPPSSYLTGVGIGRDIDQARSNARAEIAKAFRARVQQVTTDTQTESIGSKRPASTQDVENRTQVSTDDVLEGVNIAATWFDKRKGSYYALAVLNKAKTRASLAHDRADKEEALRAGIDAARSASSPLEKSRALGSAIKARRELDALRARERVLADGGAPDISAPDESEDALNRQLEAALRTIVFRIDAEGGNGSHLVQALAGRVTETGFRVLETTAPAKDSAAASFLLKCKLDIEPFDRGHPSWKFTSWTGTFDITAPDGQVIGSGTARGQEGALSQAAADVKAREAGETALSRKVQDELSKYFLSN